MTSSKSTDAGCHVRLLTPPGRSAVATIEVVGRQAVEHVSEYFHRAGGSDIADAPLREIAYGTWSDIGLTVAPAPQIGLSSSPPRFGEGVVIARIKSDRLEIHCHGGSVAAQRIIGDLLANGCRVWETDDANTETPSVANEARESLPSVLTERTGMILIDQLNGALKNACRRIATAILAGDETLAQRLLDGLLATWRAGQHLTHPWQVVVAGAANVGKSSLINALVGYERAIVFDQPGTTRDIVTALSAIDGWPVELADTAGLRDAGSDIEAEGIRRARHRFLQADVAVIVSDARQTGSQTPSGAANQATSTQADLVRQRPDAIIVHNKCDLVDDVLGSHQTGQALRTSATQHSGIDTLITAIAARLHFPTTPELGAAIVFTARQQQIIVRAQESLAKGDRDSAAELLVRIH